MPPPVDVAIVGAGPVGATLAGVLLLGLIFNILNFENGLGWISLSAYWQSVIRGLFLLTQQIGKRSMIPHKYGRILNIASIAGLRGNPPGRRRLTLETEVRGDRDLAAFARALDLVDASEAHQE